MSGIVGIVHPNQFPVERELLGKMTGFMAYRGPDAQKIWVQGSVGFGHTLLRTTDESVVENQPLTLDHQQWIVADARVDGRPELIERLQSKGESVTSNTPDSNLILQAYRVWGVDCLDYLIGDFAFAIWDEPEQRLFCARDHFGVKPFFYAQIGQGLVLSNTLNCVRLHPGVSDKLNDLAIADFLLFGYNQEVDTTTFADIQRLPAAHRLIWTPESFKVERYWTLPTDGYIRYKRDEEYVEQFLELMRLAVGDRLRTNKVAVYMSGGLDSTSITAIAKELLIKSYPTYDLRAYTTVFDRLLPDEERYYSSLVAEHLDIPIHYLVADDLELCTGLQDLEDPTPEPTLIDFRKGINQIQQDISQSYRVALSGLGGDPVLYSWGMYFHIRHCLQGGQVVQLTKDLIKYFISHGKLPPPGIRSRIKTWLDIHNPRPPYPDWINHKLAQTWNLLERWEKFWGNKPLIHPVRPEAYQQITHSCWSHAFDLEDPGVSMSQVEKRFPFFDIRLVNYLLAIPPIPWFMFKGIIRVAMKGKLPESVRLRPKTPLAGDPIAPLLQAPILEWLNTWNPTLELGYYVDCNKIPVICGMSVGNGEALINMRPLSLNYWLQQKYAGQLIKQKKFSLIC